jgi:hypothetical protein
MNIKAVAEGQIVAVFESRFDLFLVGFALKLIGQQSHHNIGPSRSPAVSATLNPAFSAFDQELLRVSIPRQRRFRRAGCCVSVTLAAITQNRGLLTLENLDRHRGRNKPPAEFSSKTRRLIVCTMPFE